MQQFIARKQLVKRSVGSRHKDCYTVQTVKQHVSIMIWGAKSTNDTTDQCFLWPDTIMNIAKYLNALKDKSNNDMLLLLITRPLLRDGGMAEDHGAPRAGQLPRA